MSIYRPHYTLLDMAVEGTQATSEIVAGLELVDVDYMGYDARKHVGQLVIASELAAEVQEIFGGIRDARFPIRSIIPIVYFGHDDHQSIAQNNTSGFNYRTVSGTDRLSQHSYGRAIDINPLFNPYLNRDGGRREGSFPYPPYDETVPGTIVRGGFVVASFVERGWEWGGNWDDSLDYQHFAKPTAATGM